MGLISIFIPVYRESDMLEDLLEDLLEDPYEDKEIFVIIDEPSLKSLRLIEKFRGKVNFVLNGERRGKAKVLNDAVEDSSGDILLFLDADVAIDGESGDFLKKVSDSLEKADIVEIKKDVVRDSILARIVSYDYLGFSSTNWFFSRVLGKCLGFNGAAFAIRREAFNSLGGFRRTICEDLDMGLRSFLKDLKFKFLIDVNVYTKAPSSWREWFKQRKRWGMGAALWLKENYRSLLGIVRESPKILLSLLLLFPSLLTAMSILIIPEDIYVKIAYILFFILSTRASILLPPTAFASTTLSMIKNMLMTVSSLLAYSSLFYILAQKMNFPFNPLEFTFYYLIYSPLWLITVAASIARLLLKPEWINIDWKV